MKTQESDDPKARFTQEELLNELENFFRLPDMIGPGDLTINMIKKFYHLDMNKDILAKMEQVVAEKPDEWSLVECRYRNGRRGKVLRRLK